MNLFFDQTRYSSNPLTTIQDMVEKDKNFETSEQFDKMRFVGYVLEIGYESVTIITADSYKQSVGGVPRGSFLVVVPDDLNGFPPHFSLLRVTSTAPTPLSKEVQQTYFELHKRSMPEIDRFTASELQWGALQTTVLGMFYPNPDNQDLIEFSGDVNNVVSGHRYKVYSPTKDLLDLIINGTLNPKNQWPLGKLRLTESRLPFQNIPSIDVAVKVSTEDFKGFRTAMFGKTRLGKSNVVKLIVESLIRTTEIDKSVGQLIFDINGEYANDNPQDGNASIRSAYEDRCQVYALTPRASTPSEPLRLNFYEQPESCMSVIQDFLNGSPLGQSGYIRSFSSSSIPSIQNTLALPQNDRVRNIRKIQIFWAILNKAGFPKDESALRRLSLFANPNTNNFNPGFSARLRTAAYPNGETPPASINNLDQLQRELELIEEFRQSNPRSNLLQSTGSGNAIFDSDDISLLQFFNPSGGGRTGPSLLRPLIDYHQANAGDFVGNILRELDTGTTVILDLGNASESIRRYFADMLSRAVFSHQENKFTNNRLGKHFIQLYFEEAHNLFPKDDKNVTDVYSRFAKEGAKFHIGMVYSTQSPTTVNKDLLAQTENFFVAHLSSQDETNALAKLQIAYDGLQKDILSSKTKGYLRMLTFSNRFVIPIQAKLFTANTKENAI
ncbi:DUF87 domain-containing protein [Flavobacteriaceae bacterium SZ-1-7]|uniref:ATP-binding protein n=1 Tax=Tamlana sedimenti TaxID=3134126 RepID=UPI00312980F4